MEKAGTLEKSYSTQEVIEAFSFWAQDLAYRSKGEMIAVDLQDPESAVAHAEYLDLDKFFYPALPLGSTPEGHEVLKERLYAFSEHVQSPGFFGEFVGSLKNNDDFIASLELLNAGENVCYLTNHPWLSNIAETQAAIYCAVDQPGFADYLNMTFSKTLGYLDIIVSKDKEGAPELVMPAIQTSQLFSKVSCSVPRSDSLEREELQVLSKYADERNRTMLTPLISEAKKGGQALTIAPSSSHDIIDQQSKKIIMKRANPIVAKILARHYSNALPIIMHKNEEGNLFFDIGKLQKLDSDESIHDVMSQMSSSYQELAGPRWTVEYPAI